MIWIAAFFIILGMAIKYGKLYFLMAGYNTLSKEAQEKIDIEGIASIFRNTMFGMGIFIIVGSVLAYYLKNSNIENIAFFGALLIGIPYLLIKSNSSKFKIDNDGVNAN